MSSEAGYAVERESFLSDIVCHCIDHFKIGSSQRLTALQTRQMVEVFKKPPQKPDGLLAGRTAVLDAHLEGFGATVVKHYHRGGLIANLVKRHYLRISKTRGQIEYEQMERASKAGINVPEPLAFGYRGRLFYEGWLISRKVPNCQTLAQLSQTFPERISGIMERLVVQVRLLVENRILHADFHPGNVLVDDQEQVYIIDFDKSTVYHGSLESLKMRYCRRWCRAVLKHGLPHLLCTPIQAATY